MCLVCEDSRHVDFQAMIKTILPGVLTVTGQLVHFISRDNYRRDALKTGH